MSRYNGDKTQQTEDGGFYVLGGTYGDNRGKEASHAFYPNKVRGYVGRIIDVNYARNGVTGRQFHSILFMGTNEDIDVLYNGVVFVCDCPDPSGEERSNRPHKCDPQCAVQQISHGGLAEGNASNNFRGDYFFYDLNQVIDEYWNAGQPYFQDSVKFKGADLAVQEAEHFQAIASTLSVLGAGSTQALNSAEE